MRYGLGMTAPTTTRPRGTALPRVAGLLFIVAQLSDIAVDFLDRLVDQASTGGSGIGLANPDEPFGILVPIFLLVGVSVVAMLLAFFLLWAWLPKTIPNAAFLALTVWFPASYL